MKKIPLFKRTRIGLMTTAMSALLLCSGFTSLSAQKITLKESDTPLKEVVKKIEDQTDLSFVYNHTLFDNSQKVNIDTDEASLDQVMNQLLANSGLAYTVKEKNLIIYKQEKATQAQQSRVITGVITDEFDDPVIGATVMVEGTTIGVVTDIDGRYSLEIPNDKNTLVISYLGYSKQTVEINNRSVINVKLSEQTINMDEVIVVGYNLVKRGQITGAIDMVKSAEITQQSSATLEDRLQGKVAGLMISSGSGQPGSSVTKIRIRGTGSINGGNTPLYIMDGTMIEEAQFASLNPDDIEDIQVLKDASATAIYGSRGANGVIVVTSKRGKEGRTSVAYNLKLGTSILRSPKDRMMTGEENLLYQYYCMEQRPGNNQFPMMLPLYYEQLEKNGTINEDQLALLNSEREHLARARVTNTDWIDEIAQNGFLMDHNISVGGGNDKTKFFVSGSFLNHDGTLKDSKLTRYSGRMNLDHKISRYVDMGVTASAGYAESHFVDPDKADGRNGWFNPWFTALLAYPYETPDDWHNGDNPTLVSKYYKQTQGNLRLLGTAYVNVYFTDWLRFKTNFGIDYRGTKNRNSLHRDHPNAASYGGSLTQSTVDRRRYTWTNTLNFIKTFNSVHALSGVGGFELYDYNYSTFSQTGYDLDQYMTESPAGIGDKTGSSANPPRIDGSRSHNNLMSFFTQWNYTYDARYSVSASLRYDESSKFVGSNKGATFWSAGAAWDLAQEEFMRSNQWIDQLKLRVSYGTTGNQEGIGNFDTRDGYSKSNYNGKSGYYTTSIANPDLKWETSAQFDLGLDFSLFGHRLHGGVDFYIKNTKDLLMTKKISYTSGSGSILTNAGSVRNTGIEIALNGSPIRTRDFEWTIGGNITFNKNKLTDLGVWDNEDHRFVDGDVLYEVGKSLGTWYMVEWAGVNPATGEIWFNDQKGGKTENLSAAPFVANFKSSEIPIFGGFQTSFRYKGLQLGANFTYSLNQTIMNASSWYLKNHNFNGNKPAYMLTMWRKEGDITNVPRFDAQYNVSPWASQFLEDASYLRLKSLRLGYTLPRTALDKLKAFNSVHIYCQGENLFTVTSYTGMDPEVSTDTDLMSYPQPISITFGLDITF